MTIDQGRIEKRIAELEKARDEFIIQANQTVSGYQAGIAELKALLQPETAEQQVQVDKDKG